MVRMWESDHYGLEKTRGNDKEKALPWPTARRLQRVEKDPVQRKPPVWSNVPRPPCLIPGFHKVPTGVGVIRKPAVTHELPDWDNR